MTHVTTDVKSLLRAALASSMRARDNVATGAIRAALAELANAESVPIEHHGATPAGDQYIAGSSVGLGATEAARRSVSETEARAILRREIDARRTSAIQFRAQGREDEAEDLARGADVLESALSSIPA